jgi:tRNA G18 (ribose-2'-O)-methylase SpoU
LTAISYTSHGATRSPLAGAASPILEAVLDNVRSIRNVGSMFRTADGAGITHLHLCGITPTPEHQGLRKTALGAERAVPWSYHPNARQAAGQLREQGKRLWAIDGGPSATSLFDPALATKTLAAAEPIALVFGHEVSGVDPEVTRLCERVIEIPMFGTKNSLNVSVAFGIVAYALRFASGGSWPPTAPG